MKKLMILATAAVFLALYGCKKDPTSTAPDSPDGGGANDDGGSAESAQIAALESDHRLLESGDLKSLLDTNTLAPTARYVVLFKSSFRAPLAESYTGAPEGREAAAEVYDRVTRATIRNHFRPGLVDDNEVIEWYSVLSSGFYAELSAAKVRELYRDPVVKCISIPPTYETDAAPTYDTGTKPLFVHGYKSAGGSSKRIWIIDNGGNTSSPHLNVDLTRSKSYISGSAINSNCAHGNKVAHIAAAKQFSTYNLRGTAEGAKVVIMKTGNGSTLEWAAINSALSDAWLYSNNGDIINMSLSANTVGVSNSTKALITELENNVLDFKGYDMPVVMAAGNQATQASNRTPARLGLKYKDDPINYGFLYVTANCVPLGTEAQVKARTTTFKLNDDYSSNYGRAVRYGLVGTWWTIDAAGVFSLGSGTSFAAPALAGMLYTESPSVNTFSALTNVLKYKKGSTNYTHLVPTLF